MTFKTFFENMPQKKVVALSASALILAAGWQLYNVIAAKPQPAKVIPLVLISPTVMVRTKGITLAG